MKSARFPSGLQQRCYLCLPAVQGVVWLHVDSSKPLSSPILSSSFLNGRTGLIKNWRSGIYKLFGGGIFRMAARNDEKATKADRRCKRKGERVESAHVAGACARALTGREGEKRESYNGRGGRLDTK